MFQASSLAIEGDTDFILCIFKNCFKLWGRRGREGGRAVTEGDQVLSHLLHSLNAHNGSECSSRKLGPGSWKLNPGLPWGWQEPDYLSLHCCLPGLRYHVAGIGPEGRAESR